MVVRPSTFPRRCRMRLTTTCQCPRRATRSSIVGVPNQPLIAKPGLGKLKNIRPRERRTDFLGVKVSPAKLPSASPDLFGREEELKALDEAWEMPGTTF